MKIVGMIMFGLPLVAWYFFCARDMGHRKALRLLGWTVGGMTFLIGWYMLAWKFVQ